MGIGFFPPKRRVIIEKFKQEKTSEKNLFRLEFMDFKYPEIFIADSVSPISTITTYARAPGLEHLGTPTRIEWQPITFKLIECEGPGNGERLSTWVNSHLFSEYHSNPRATSIKVKKIYDDKSEESGWWTLYGCIPTAVTEENGSISLEFQINHGVLHI
jgi:hypothetical protein